MITDKKIRELEKAKRQSGGAIPVLGCAFLFTATFIWLLSKFVEIPAWLSIIVIGLTAFAFVGDVINYLYCDWKLKALKRESVDKK